MKNKYNSKLTYYKKRCFHSKRESQVAKCLDTLIEKGDVHAWFPQVTFHLRGFDGNFLGKKYITDFLVFKPDENKDGKEVLVCEIWDVKGFVCETYKLKRSVLSCQGIHIVDDLKWGEGLDLTNSRTITCR